MIIDNQDELKIGELPPLKIMAIEEITYHEYYNVERSTKLINRLSEEGKLRNPPIVGYVKEDNRYILLDGNNRVTALKSLDVPHVLVQEVDFFDPKLIISEWHHVIENLNLDLFYSHIQKLGLDLEDWQPDYLYKNLLCRLLLPNNTRLAVRGGRDIFDRVQILKEFTDLYHQFANMDRVSYTNLEHLKLNYPKMDMLVSFPAHSKDDVLALVKKDLKIPSGITRIILPKRALQFNIQLDFLKAHTSLQEKNVWLCNILHEKSINKQVRFYREPTFVLDE